MLNHCPRLSLSSLARVFWRPISLTWILTLLETALLVALPLLIGRAIDGLLSSDSTPFLFLLGTMAALLFVAVGRRIYDTRVYGTIGVELGTELVSRSNSGSVSAVNAHLDMSSELVQFLELELPQLMGALINLIFAVTVLLLFHAILAISVVVSITVLLLIYSAFSSRFFSLNRAVNQQTEHQVTVLAAGSEPGLLNHLAILRQQTVRLSDTEALVYGLIFLVLMSMLGFNLWFAATQIGATPGQIFSIVTYSLNLMESAVVLPATLQSYTRLSEITERINDVATS
jgi:hypothetical protein